MNFFEVVFFTYGMILTSSDMSVANYPIRRAVLTSFVDPFLPGSGGKPELGNAILTCWARGGICVQVQHCPSMNFDATVPGCTRNYRVCCRVAKLGSPTVGVARTSSLIPLRYIHVHDLEDPIIDSVADNNYKFLVNII